MLGVGNRSLSPVTISEEENVWRAEKNVLRENELGGIMSGWDYVAPSVLADALLP